MAPRLTAPASQPLRATPCRQRAATVSLENYLGPHLQRVDEDLLGRDRRVRVVVDERLAAEQHRIVRLLARALTDGERRDIVHHFPAKQGQQQFACNATQEQHVSHTCACIVGCMACRWRKECLVACSGFRRWLGENAHLSVCFVSGYLGFSAGRLTRGVPSMSAGLKMEVCLSTTISGTLVPPKRIGVRKPATWKPVSSIPLADSSVSRALPVAARAAARAKRRGAREEKLSRPEDVAQNVTPGIGSRKGAGPPAPLRVRAPGLVAIVPRQLTRERERYRSCARSARKCTHIPARGRTRLETGWPKAVTRKRDDSRSVG